jgi:hypothetical protein
MMCEPCTFGFIYADYDTKSNGIGKLSVVKGPNGYKKELSYDAFGRVSFG